MKWFIILFLFPSVSLLSQIGENNNRSEIVVKATYKGEYYSCYYDSIKCSSCRTIRYLIDVKLINNSNAPIEFWILRCSPSMNIVVDTIGITNCVNFCISDSQININLKPKQEFSIPVILETEKRIDKEIKIGFIYLNSKKVNYSQFHMSLNEAIDDFENVLWSHPIKFGIRDEHPFEIKQKFLENLSPF